MAEEVRQGWPSGGDDTGRRNMELLLQLRWIAVGGQLFTIAVVHGLLGVRIPLVPLLVVPALLAAINLVSCRSSSDVARYPTPN